MVFVTVTLATLELYVKCMIYVVILIVEIMADVRTGNVSATLVTKEKSATKKIYVAKIMSTVAITEPVTKRQEPANVRTVFQATTAKSKIYAAKFNVTDKVNVTLLPVTVSVMSAILDLIAPHMIFVAA